MENDVQIYLKSDSCFALKSRYSPEIVEAIKRLFWDKKWNPTERQWEISITKSNFAAIDELNASVGMDAALEPLLKRFLDHQAFAETLNQELSIPADFSTSGSFKLKKFQVDGVRYLVNKPKVLFWDDMGLGKTLQSITAIELRDAFPCVVVCPAGFKDTWSQVWRSINPDRKVQIMRQGVKVDSSADIFIVGYSGVGKYLPELLSVFPVSLIADEAHEIKNFKLSRFKNLRKLAQQVPVIYLLTGTPVLNRPMELIAPLILLDLLDPVFGGFEAFISRYCAARKTFFGWDYSGASNLEELNQRLVSHWVLRRTKAQVENELPTKTVHFKTVEIDNREEYNLEFYNLRPFRDGLDVTQGVAWMDRLRLLAALGKLPTFYQWADGVLGSGHKLVIFAYHAEVLSRIREHFKCPIIDGKISDKAKTKIVYNFQNDHTQRVIGLNLRSGGTGWTLTAASVVAFLQHDWSPKVIDQAEDRVHRIGQLQPVDSYRFIGRNTIDEMMIELTDKKRKSIEGVADEHLTIKQVLFDLLENNIAA